MVANALEHSDSDAVTIRCALAAGAATVAVTDEGDSRGPTAVTATAVPPGYEQERGRGLLITGALAARWGTERTGRGLTVWAEVVTGTREPTR